MDELDRHAAQHHLVGDLAVAGGVGAGRDGQSRAEALAAGADQVAGDLGEIGVVGDDRVAQGLLDPFELAIHPG